MSDMHSEQESLHVLTTIFEPSETVSVRASLFLANVIQSLFLIYNYGPEKGNDDIKSPSPSCFYFFTAIAYNRSTIISEGMATLIVINLLSFASIQSN